MRTLPTIFVHAALCLALFPGVRSAGADSGPAVTVDEREPSLAQLEDAHRLYPYDAVVRRALGAAYGARGRQLMDSRDFAAAAGIFEKGRELYPDDPTFGTLAGIACYLQGQPDLARFQLERARALAGRKQPSLYAYLGRVHYDAGDLRRALEVWGEGLEAAPDDTVLRDLVSRARRDLAVEQGMKTGNSSRFLISYDGSVRADAADLVLEELEGALREVGGDLGWYPEQPIPVILYTKRDYQVVTESPDWAGGVYDGKIRLPVGGLKGMTPRLRAVLRHEYTHAVVRALTLGNCPVWLNEGLAEYEGRRAHDVPLADLQQALPAGGAATLSPPEGAFVALQGDEARLAYETSHSLVSHMIRSYGMHTVRDLLLELGKGARLPEAAGSAFRGVGLSWEQVLQEWRQSFR
jgi:tetratricopeptide (TPR) repeat protein